MLAALYQVEVTRMKTLYIGAESLAEVERVVRNVQAAQYPKEPDDYKIRSVERMAEWHELCWISP